MSNVRSTAQKPDDGPAPARVRVALIVPSTNTVAETECWRMAPPGVTVHTSRMPFFPERFERPLDAMETHLERVLEEATSADPHVVAYGCTASSAVGEPHAYEARLSRLAGCPVVSAAAAILDGLEALHANSLALLTPYPPAVTQHEARFFSANGYHVAATESLIVDPAQQRLRNMRNVPVALIVERGISLVRQHDVDALVLACTDMPALDAIEAIETAVAKPVVTSTQALFWRALARGGASGHVTGAGRLFVR